MTIRKKVFSAILSCVVVQGVTTPDGNVPARGCLDAKMIVLNHFDTQEPFYLFIAHVRVDTIHRGCYGKFVNQTFVNREVVNNKTTNTGMTAVTIHLSLSTGKRSYIKFSEGQWHET